MFIILGFPHLVLTDVRNDKCLSFGQVPEIIDDMSCPELATIRQKLDVSHCSITFELLDVFDPDFPVTLVNQGYEGLKGFP